MLTVIKQREFWIMVALFLATLFIMVQDPLKVNPNGFEGTNAWVGIYFIPAIITWFFLYVKPTRNG